MQRVAIGRSLVRQPSIYLMDEPLSSLDAKLRADLRIELKRIQTELGATILYVTHDQTEAMTMANRIGVMDKGHLVQVGTPREIYERPNSIYVAQKLGQPPINLVPAGLLEGEEVHARAKMIGARTEHVSVKRDRKGGASIARIEHLGDQVRLHIRCKDHKLVTLASPGESYETGDHVNISLKRPICFDAEGLRLN
jgi:multiple sugar transport system ATP-binding protein